LNAAARRSLLRRSLLPGEHRVLQRGAEQQPDDSKRQYVRSHLRHGLLTRRLKPPLYKLM
jgi:hypothetical protein